MSKSNPKPAHKPSKSTRTSASEVARLRKQLDAQLAELLSLCLRLGIRQK